MRRGLYGLIVALVVVGVAQGATLELRAVGSASVEVGEAASFEIVLTVEAGEDVAYASLFLDFAADDGGSVVLFDFEPGADVPAGILFDRTFLGEGATLPLAEGEEITLDEYALNLGGENADIITGPGEIVLEQVYVRGVTTGTVDIMFETAPRAPELTEGDSPDFTDVPVETPTSTLTFDVVEAAGPGIVLPPICGFGALGAMLLCFAGLTLMKLNGRRN